MAYDVITPELFILTELCSSGRLTYQIIILLGDDQFDVWCKTCIYKKVKVLMRFLSNFAAV